jgi:hypothetical protein
MDQINRYGSDQFASPSINDSFFTFLKFVDGDTFWINDGTDKGKK